ncbi:DUF2142 domain-containing protein [Paraburkholderia caballeronis]|uniref:Uncharacterized membrane protein n=1 Tax=Paraburkholderia caballeronis TaxID=416943 RepID=A0A1H7R4H4_9BURK|nr:DUF2142 domain-containing protein [Paraburkholderia caballeronis]PXW23663.1 putative membrane protein [Paraburkholderia caballeronis]PXW99004.1 putative membrane protein [Paraburkholderia caballeronis]RAJ96210.1 putative membrane protein [Paraburkholderia caballeronis]SEC82431.1 Uncharacterized membrane protein [Paraburkholderia caballeronis]SEL55083.1 Uncharacterized membrane protein [Paraburkholderia caballeronis]
MSIFREFLRLISLRRFSVLYLCYALPSGLFLAIATPPFQTPDALNHFYRAVQISEGHLVGQRVGRFAGGAVDQGVSTLGALVNPMRFHPDVKFTSQMRSVADATHWSNVQIDAAFPNTVFYPAYAYLPQAVAIGTGRMFNATIARTYLLTCVVDLLISIGLTCWALIVSRRTSLILFATALLPSTLMLFSSVSQEALVIPVAFVLIAHLDRFLHDGRRLSWRHLLLAGLALLLCISARPPYVGVLLVLLCPGLRVGGTESAYGFWRRVVWIVAVGVVAVAIVEIFSHGLWVPMSSPISAPGQIAYLLHHPVDVFPIAVATLKQNAGFYFESFVGILGWLDTRMSPTYYAAARAMFVAVFVATMFQGRVSERGLLVNRLLIFVAVLLCVAMIFASLYLTWTPVGQRVVEGVQGRYFLPLFPLLGLLLPAFIERGRVPAMALQFIDSVCIALVVVFPLYTFVELIETIVVRFYG